MLVDLGKLIAAKGFKSCPKSKKLPDLVTLQENNNNIRCGSKQWVKG